MSQVPKQITITEPLWASLEEVGKELGYGKRPHSKLIREMVSSSIMKWRESPYVCTSARHLIFVTAEGHIFYRLIQDLALNSYRHRLPCMIEMKPEKQLDFLRERDSDTSEAEWLRSRWLINHFAAWHRETNDGSKSNTPHNSWGAPLDQSVDRIGMVHKMADLRVEQGTGRFLTREIVIGLQDYVQWHDGPQGYDRVDLPIDIPTRNLEIFVVLDIDLYRKTPVSLHEIPHLDLEFRNREGARFEAKDFSRDQDNPLRQSFGKYIEGDSDAKTTTVRAEIRNFKDRLESLTRSTVDGIPTFTEQERSTLQKTFVEPQRFLFLRGEWPTPYFGVEVCARWEKAVRVN